MFVPVSSWLHYNAADTSLTLPEAREFHHSLPVGALLNAFFVDTLVLLIRRR